MKSKATAFLAVAALICMIPAVSLALSPFSTDFESYATPAPGGLMGNGWLVYGNVFGLDWGYWYGYGAFPAPNDGAAFCAIATGEGGPAQGMQQLSVYSDYNNSDQTVAYIEANVFQEQTIGVGDVSETWLFEFDAKLGNLVPPTTAVAFIKILNPMDWSSIYIPLDMTNIPASWDTYSIAVGIDPTWAGRIMQIGFASTTTGYASSGIFYDNINFAPTGPVGTEEMSFGDVKSLFR